jgi:hypothetical protein
MQNKISNKKTKYIKLNPLLKSNFVSGDICRAADKGLVYNALFADTMKDLLNFRKKGLIIREDLKRNLKEKGLLLRGIVTNAERYEKLVFINPPLAHIEDTKTFAKSTCEHKNLIAANSKIVNFMNNLDLKKRFRALCIAALLTHHLGSSININIDKLITDHLIANRPPVYIGEDNLIPHIINPVDTIDDSPNLDPDNPDAPESALIQLSQSALVAVENFKTNLNELFQIYNFYGYEGTLTPNFVTVNYDADNILTSIRIYSNLEDGRAAYMDFFVDDLADFERVFNSSIEEIENKINGLNTMINCGNIADIPIITIKLDLENSVSAYPSDVKMETKLFENEEDESQTYDLEVYSFKISYTDENKLYIKSIYIPVEEANKIEGFNNKNLASLYELYLQDSSLFIEEEAIEQPLNHPSIILLSANKINSQSQEEGSSEEDIENTSINVVEENLDPENMEYQYGLIKQLMEGKQINIKRQDENIIYKPEKSHDF